MHTNEAGIELIKRFEGFSAEAYECAGGKQTIGYGHALKRGEHFTEITKDQAEALLYKDVLEAERAVQRGVEVPLNENQFSALVSWTFNLGEGALQKSTMRNRLNAGDYDAVPSEMKRWNRAKGVVLQGLVNRREAEAELFMKPVT